jgi:hypothetical protein
MTRDYLNARKPKRLQEGKMKFNERQSVKAEVGSWWSLWSSRVDCSTLTQREKDQLFKALKNPEHHNLIRDMSSNEDVWSSNTNS